MATPKQINYTENDRAIVAALKTGDMTLAQICEASGSTILPGHIVSAMKKGLIASVGKVNVPVERQKEVCSYNFVTGDVLLNAKGEPYSYTDGALAILKVAATMDSPFTLADLASAMGLEKISSGSITHLVKKGNLSKGEPVTVSYTDKSTVSVYTFVADIPNA